jgi:hypothetical protein
MNFISLFCLFAGKCHVVLTVNLFRKIFTLFLCSMFMVNVSLAQKSVEDEQIDIIKPYKPVLSEAVKISDIPRPDTAVYNIPELQYNFSLIRAGTQYQAPLIVPVKVKDEVIAKLYRSYAKLGFGNYTTPLVDLKVNSLRSKTFDVGGQLSHMSGRGKFKNKGFPGYSDNEASVFGTRFFTDHKLSGKINYDRDVIHHYGYSLADTILSKKDIRQEINQIGGDVSFGSYHLDKTKIRHQSKLSFTHYADRFQNKESEFDINLWGKKNINKITASLYFDTELFTNKDSVTSESSSIIRISPMAGAKIERLELEGGIRAVVGKGPTGSEFRIIPRLSFSYHVAENFLIAFADLDGNLEKNSYSLLKNRNPFYVPDLVIPNTETRFNFKAGLKGSISNATSFNAFVRYRNVTDLVMFATDTSQALPNKFSLITDDVNILNLQGEITFVRNEKIRILGSGTYNTYSMTREKEAWYMPSIEIRLASEYNISDKIIAKGNIFTGHGRKARIFNEQNLISGKELKDYIDFNIGADYRYSKVLSVFLDLNNVLNSKYERWINYPDQRLNILGGLTYSF